MTSAIAHAFNPPQLEAANLLNLVIVDDERAVRDVCSEVAQSLGFNTMVAEEADSSAKIIPSRKWRGRRFSARSRNSMETSC
jgi:CheY-like chemotaxis protein